MTENARAITRAFLQQMISEEKAEAEKMRG